MNRSTLKWISLSAASAVLVAGCAAGPNRAPERNPNAGNNVSTTTGDADACAVALGNTVAAGGTMNPGDGVGLDTTPGGGDAGTAVGPTGGAGGGGGAPGGMGGAGADAGGRGREITANGVIIGNVALVALPGYDNMPTSPPTAGTPGAALTPVNPAGPGAAPGAAGAAPGAAAPGTAGAATLPPGGTTVGAPGTRTTADTIVPGTKGTPAPITGAAAPPTPTVTAPAPPGNPNAAGAPGGVQDNRFRDPGPAGTAADTAAGDADAIERIRTACDKVADIRVVNTAGDRIRLAQITDAIRDGRPITEFMTDITRMTQAATSVGGGRNANPGAGAPGGAAPGGAAPGGAAPGGAAPGAPGLPAVPDIDVPGIEVPPAEPDENAPATTPATPGLP